MPIFASNRTLLLGVAGVAEAATGLALMVAPAVVAFLLLGLAEIPPEALVFARMLGAALLSIGAASWLARNDTLNAGQRAQIVGLAIYYGLGAIVLAYASVFLKLSGVLLWPAALIHALLAVWCLVCLREPGTHTGHLG